MMGKLQKINMNRYLSTKIDKRWDGSRVYLTTIYPRVPVAENDVYIISKETDKLDVLADKYYKDKTLWWIIAQANKVGKGGMSIEEGIQIRIPVNISRIVQNFININS